MTEQPLRLLVNPDRATAGAIAQHALQKSDDDNAPLAEGPYRRSRTQQDGDRLI